METQDQSMNTENVKPPSPILSHSLPSMTDSSAHPRNPEFQRQLRYCVKARAQKGDYLGAIAILNRLIAISPNSAIDYNNRGLMYYCIGNFVRAIKDYNQAIKINNKLAQAYNNRANCYAAQGNLAAAIRDYETSLDLNPTSLKTWLNQGITFRELGLYDLALENFDLVLAFGKKLTGRAYGERGYTYHLRGDWNCAIADYKRALSLLPMTSKLKSYRAKVQNWLNQLLNFSLAI